MRLGITDYLDCAHLLPGHTKCGRLHGHTYRVRVVVEGEMRDGMLVDFADLRAQVRGVFARYDHRYWNDLLDYPSVENICELLAEELAKKLAFRFTLRVYEGHAKWAETAREPRGTGEIEA